MIFEGFLGCSSGDSTIFEPDMQLILPWNRLIPKSNPQRLWVGRFSVVLIFVQVLCEFVCLLIISGMRVNLKKDALEFMIRCLDFHQVKAQCKPPGGLLELIVIPEWKW